MGADRDRKIKPDCSKVNPNVIVIILPSTKTKKNLLVSSLVNYALRNALQVQENNVYKLNLVEEGVKTFNNGSYCDSNLNLKFVIISKATAV